MQGATQKFDLAAYRAGRQTPVFFGSAIANFGVEELLKAFVEHAPGPLPRETRQRTVEATEPKLSGLRVQDPGEHGPLAPRPHRLPAALLRQVHPRHAHAPRAAREGGAHRRRADLLLAADRSAAEDAYAGDIIGLHNHGTINIGDSFTEGEPLVFTGIPNFAPEMFRRAVLRDPLKMKALSKGLAQLCEEGATQLFRPLRNNDQILGAVGQLQFEVVAFRLQDEYAVQCTFEPIGVHTARWVQCADEKMLAEFRTKAYDNLALDHYGGLVYLAPSRVNLGLTIERWPGVAFRETREQGG